MTLSDQSGVELDKKTFFLPRLYCSRKKKNNEKLLLTARSGETMLYYNPLGSLLPCISGAAMLLTIPATSK